MADPNLDKLLERIRKLLAVTIERGATEDEAATAAELVQTLLAKYNLDLGDLKRAGKKFAGRGYQTDSRPWRRFIGGAVAKMYFCIYSPTFKREPSTRKAGYIRYDLHYFFGEEHNQLVAGMMFAYLTGVTEALAFRGAKLQPAKDRTSYISSFQAACAHRLMQRILERVRAASEGQAKDAEGSKLPALRDAYQQAEDEVSKWLKKTFKTESREVSVRSKIYNRAGLRDGEASANRIGLDTQLSEKRAGELPAS